MTDYLERIAAAKADIARLKGEKEAFEQSHAPDDLDEEELAEWNYAKDLDRRIRELRPARSGRRVRSVPPPASPPPELAALEAALKPYEEIKKQLAEARARYRTLTDEFVSELKSRCGAMNDDQKRALVLELLAQDVQAGLDAAMAEKRQELVRFIEGLWDKYRVTLAELRDARVGIESELASLLKLMKYV
jgi:type I restriction enzyme M protein